MLKYKRCKPRSYRGIDISHTAIEAAAARIAQIGLACRINLECHDFTKHDWGRQACAFDAISCHFALQYAFASELSAQHVVSRVASSLKPGGVFVGTIPVHEGVPTHEAVVVQLPDDERRCIEYSAPKDDVIALCAKHGLVCEIWASFDAFYDDACRRHPELLRIMHADVRRPERGNAVFAFTKGSPVTPT